jgi:alanyl-tRNA synthetase
MELCGGTHCRATGDIGFFAVVSEGGVAAGVRRIEAVTGAAAVELHQSTRTRLHEVLDALGTTPDRARGAVDHLHARVRSLEQELTQQKIKNAAAAVAGVHDAYEPIEVGGVRLLRQKVTGLEKDALRGLVDALRSKLGSGVVVVGSVFDDKAQVVAGVTPDLTDRVHAGALIRTLAPIIGGRGGGRPDFAEAGGKESDKIDRLLEESVKALEALITASRRQG